MQAIIDCISYLTTYLWGGTFTPDGGTAVTVTWANSWLGTLCTTVINNPILLVFVVLGIVGIAVGFFKRLTR